MKIELTRKKLNKDRVRAFGFSKKGGNYFYTAGLVDGQFDMTVTIFSDGTLETKVIDVASGEEYVLHLTEAATGAFVGRVRKEYDAVLDKIVDACYADDIFKTDYANRLIKYVGSTYGDELEFLWEKFPDNAVWRRKDNQKWYAVLLTVSRRKLGLESDETVEIIDLRMQPEDVVKTVNHTTFFPGWHMNKKNWITILPDGSVEFEEICRRLDESYQIAKG